MRLIVIKDVLGRNPQSNNDGQIIQDLIKNGFSKQQKVQLSFRDVSTINTSFANTAIGDLLVKYPIDYIKNNLIIKDSTKQINSTIQLSMKVSQEHYQKQ